MLDRSPASRKYACADEEIEVRVETAEQWQGLAVSIGRPELAYEGSWEAVRTADADGPVAQVLQEHFAEEPVAIWMRRLDAHGVPCRRVERR